MFLLTEAVDPNVADSLSLLINSISSLGFPIVMCIIMMKYMKEKDEANRLEIKELSKAVENNTLVMSKLMQRLGILNKVLEQIGVTSDRKAGANDK